jgi:hypothetical protein
VQKPRAALQLGQWRLSSELLCHGGFEMGAEGSALQLLGSMGEVGRFFLSSTALLSPWC